MKEYKEEEIKYYDKEAIESSGNKELGSKQGFDPFLLSSYRFLKKLLKGKCYGKKVLDYGSGTGIHSKWLVEYGADVVGIDLSKNSIEKAKAQVSDVEFIEMDCEKMDFKDNTFDIVFNGGTLSSLDLDKVLPELKRVLKPNGIVIGIETLGHNPITNLKRNINVRKGKRTEWARDHIFKMKDLKKTKMYFSETKSYYFHLISWIAFPFLSFYFGIYFLRLLEAIDTIILFLLPFLKRYCFKIVFVFKNI